MVRSGRSPKTDRNWLPLVDQSRSSQRFPHLQAFFSSFEEMHSATALSDAPGSRYAELLVFRSLS